MGDIPFIPPSSASGQVQIVSSSATTQNATAGQVPTTLAKLPHGFVLVGVISGRDRNGQPILRTAQGTLTLKSADFLTDGSKVTLRLDKEGGQTQARILAVDGKPLSQASQTPGRSGGGYNDASTIISTSGKEAQSQPNTSTPYGRTITPTLSGQTNTPTPQGQAQPQQTATLNAPLPASTVTHGSQFPLQILSPSPQASPLLQQHIALTLPALLSALPTGNNNALPAGTTLGVQVTGIQPPTLAAEMALASHAGSVLAGDSADAAPTAQAQTTPTTGNPTPQGGQTTTNAAQVTPAAPPPLPPASTTLSAEQAAVANPTTNTNSTPTNTPAQTAGNNIPGLSGNTYGPTSLSPGQSITSFTAVITQHDPASGETQLRWPLGTARTVSSTPLEAGTTLTLRVTGVAPPSAQPVNTSPLPVPIVGQPAPMQELASRWDSLHTVQQLIAASPEAATVLPRMMEIIPQPNAQMASSTLFFLIALQGGDARKWLGKDVSQWLERNGHIDLLGRLSTEFSTIRQVFADTGQPNQPWQSAFVPVFDGQQWQQARWFSRQGHQEDQSSGDGENTRFILELNLSHFGEMQLDGLYRELRQGKQFDLMVRTHQELEPEIKQEITRLFTQALSAGDNIGGSVDFSVMPTFPVTPLEELQQQSNPPSGLDGIMV